MKSVVRILAVSGLLVGLLITTGPVGAAGGQFFSETGHSSDNAFYDFWLAHGGVSILGYPISVSYRAKDGFITQFYERSILEWHPENSRDNRVLVARLGSALLDVETSATSKENISQRLRSVPARSCTNSDNCRTFAETNHTVKGAFLDFWNINGGIATFGYPLTEEFSERQAETSNQSFAVQYFERERFEWHPEINGGTVLLGRLGASELGFQVRDGFDPSAVTVPDYDNGSQSPPTSTPPPASAPVYNPPPPPTPIYIPPPVTSPPPAPAYNLPPTVSSGPVSGFGGVCPAGYPIKANDNSGIYHVPGGLFYDATNAYNCFATEAAAAAAGYRRSLQ